jgi:hypothetical protein
MSVNGLELLARDLRHTSSAISLKRLRDDLGILSNELFA